MQFFDEEWKDEMYGGVEGWWGLFTKEYGASFLAQCIGY